MMNTDELPPLADENDLQSAQKILTGDVPLMSPSTDLSFTLPRGKYVDGKWERDVVLRELTGVDEEILASRAKDNFDFLDYAVALGVASIGPIDLTEMSVAERRDFLASLLVGEREQLFLNIARVTYGDSKVLNHTCPACEVEIETTLILSEDLKSKEMDNPSQLTFTFTTAKGDELTYQLVTGADQAEVLRRKGATMAEANTLLLTQVITKVNGHIPLDPTVTARNLSMGDRSRLIEALREAQPSPDLSLTVPCFSCGFEMVLALTWADIFRP